MRTVSLANLTMVDARPDDLIAAALAGGFNAVGLRIRAGNPLPMPEEIVGRPDVIRRIRSRLQDAGLQLLDCEALAILPGTDVADFEPALDAAADLGARGVNATGCDPDLERTVDVFASLCEGAHARGLRVALEFLPYRSVRTLQDAQHVIARAGVSNAGVLVDALHLSRSGGDPQDLAQLPEGAVSHAQVCDAGATIPPLEALPEEARFGRLYPGDGALWLDRLAERLPPGLPLALEAPVKAYAGLPAVERGRLAGAAFRGWMARVGLS